MKGKGRIHGLAAAALSLVIVTLASVVVQAQENQHTPVEAIVPEWAKSAIWYQIFPERFRNGDTSNDPTAAHIGEKEGWEVSSWTSDWYARSAYEQSIGPSFYDFATKRRYGGDIQGVIDKLDYLSELGVNAIWFNPIFDARTMHKYDATYYHHIDRFFGTDPAEDERLMAEEDPGNPATWAWTTADRKFLELLEKAHERGIRIVLDGVWNHTGPEFWAFRDIVRNQEKSPYGEWYEITSWDDPATVDKNEFDYNGWWGYKGLPNFKEDADGHYTQSLKEHLFAVTRRWMDPNGDGDPSDGIDGWRLDVAEEVSHEFWKEWHALVRDLNPEAYTTAEIWSEKAVEFINKEEFSAAMNYRFLRPVHKFFIKESLLASQLDTALANVRADYSTDVNLAMQNLMESHDTERLGSQIVNADRDFKERSKGWDGYEVRKPNAEELKIQKLIATFQFTYVGAPMVYYGTEAGMWGADDPDDRKPMLWPEFDYAPEINHPYSKGRPRDENVFNTDLFEHYKALAATRTATEVLRTGDYRTLYTSDDAKVIVFARFNKKGNVAIAVFNRGGENHEVELDLGFLKRRRIKKIEVKVGDITVEQKKKKLSFTVSAMSSAVLAN